MQNWINYPGRGKEPWLLVHRARNTGLSDKVSMLPKYRYCLCGLGLIQRQISMKKFLNCLASEMVIIYLSYVIECHLLMPAIVTCNLA